MPVITTDILIEGIRRDDVLAWLSDPKNHDTLVEGAFDGTAKKGTGEYDLTLKVSPKARVMGYRFDHVDEEHGGRRVHVVTTGKRTNGRIHYSLRTMKPSTNTLVTLHYDFDSGGPIGQIMEALGLRKRLEDGFRQILDNLKAAVKHG